jgi:hypothetical protein
MRVPEGGGGAPICPGASSSRSWLATEFLVVHGRAPINHSEAPFDPMQVYRKRLENAWGGIVVNIRCVWFLISIPFPAVSHV